ncbi:MAG: TRAP transporter substrate-binding protein [Betaproteobacteria bacterium]|nr:TRAP transporter substrate-binding protein [Betaproteobacteria bacterium]
MLKSGKPTGIDESRTDEKQSLKLSRRSVVAGAAAAVGLSAVGALLPRRASAQSKTVIRIGTVVNLDHPENVGARKIKELVEARSNGALEVQIFTDSRIGDQRTMVENLRNGVQEITWVTVGFFGSYEPILNIVESGYLFRDSQHSYKVFDGPFGNEIRALVENHGVKLLGFYEAGMRHLTNSARPVNTPNDLKGLKIRTPQAKYHLNTLKMMGANPVAMAFPEVYAALQQKVIDGQENPLSNIFFAKFYEVNKFISMTGHLHLTHMVMYSDKLWSRLSPPNQAIVRQAVIDSQEAQRKAVRDDDARLLAEIKKTGAVVNEADRAAFRNAVLPLREEAQKEFGAKAKQWIDMIEGTT